MEKKLIEYMKYFTLVDLLGFANILGVEEEDDFEEFCSKIVFEFTKQKRKFRREMLKLAKDVCSENRRVAALDKKETEKINNDVMPDGV